MTRGLTVFVVLTSLFCGYPSAASSRRGAEQGEAVRHVSGTVRVVGGAPKVRVGLTARAAGEASEAPRLESFDVVGGSSRVELSLGRGTSWEVQASAPGYWSPAAVVAPGSEPTLKLTLWPAAKVRGVLHIPSAAEAPKRLDFELLKAPGAADVGQPKPPVSVGCRVEKLHVADCAVPAGRWNLRVQAPGFAPHFLWDRKVEVGKGLDLGDLALRLGGSIFGQVTTSEGPADRRRASVEIQPVTDPGLVSDKEAAGLKQLGTKALINAWGYFQLEGVAPGSYQVRASQPGFSPAVRSPVAVKRGAVTDLEDPLVLSRPLRLSVTIDPPSAPFQKPWKLRVHRSKGSQLMDQVAEGATDATGYWRSRPLRAGPYRLEVLDGQGNRVAWRKIDLETSSQEVDLELPLIWLQGKVVLGDDPLEAHLWFGGIGGTESVEADSDDSGEFLAILPRDGKWTVDVQADSPPVTSRGLSVDVKPEAGLRTADARIEVPDTSISGDVVNEVGTPVPGAEVDISSYGKWRGAFKATTDPEGQFEVRGLSPGPYAVEAESADQTSDSVLTSVADGFSPTVHLILQKSRMMAGSVFADSGPVAGARVIAYPVVSGRPATSGLAEGRTDLKGRFAVKIPRSATLVHLLVLAPGYDLAIRRVTRGSTLGVHLSPLGGTLHLSAAPDGSVKAKAASFGLLMVDGEPVDLPRLELWARMNGVTGWHHGALAVPDMPPGQYAYCRLSLQEALLVIGGAAAPSEASCTEGYLVPGGDLSLAP